MTLFVGIASSALGALQQGGARWVASQPGDYDPSSGHGPEWGKAAPAGLLIWLFLGVALFFLIKSMNRQLRRVPKSFDADGAETGDGNADGGNAHGDAARDSAADDAVTSSSSSPNATADGGTEATHLGAESQPDQSAAKP